MPQPNDLSRSLVALDQDSTIIAVIEMSQSSWLVGGVLPGIERQPCKKLEPSPEQLLGLLHRWRDEAVRAGRNIMRIAVAFEAGRDGFWLARWVEARVVEAHVIHPSSVAVSREHRRAKTDRLDTELLKRGFLGWLRGERGHCTMARVPKIAEEDAKRPNRERECLVGERTRIVNRMKGTLARLGIRNFKPTPRKAAERLATLHTPEGSPLPPNVAAELQRDMGRLRFVGTRAMLQRPRSPRGHLKKPRFNNSVSSRSVFARRCSRDTATLEGWITCASTPRASSQRASQKPSRPASKATAIRVISLPALIASSRQRCSRPSSPSAFGSSFLRG